MKLAEALSLRADLVKRMAQKKALLDENVRVQEGDTPTVEPRDLLSEWRDLSGQLTSLIVQINRTNAQTTLTIPNGQTVSLMEAIALRDLARTTAELYRGVAAKAGARNEHRYMRTEVKYTSVVNAKEMLDRADEESKRHREIDVAIQQTNWATDLL